MDVAMKQYKRHLLQFATTPNDAYLIHKGEVAPSFPLSSSDVIGSYVRSIGRA